MTGADDDHCPPGRLRRRDQDVNFGSPRHRGVEGGQDCEQAFFAFTKALQHEYRDHDPILQAFAAHYHLAAVHPFLDGNGRTARALEALILQRAGLHDTSFIAMSNYYYDEKGYYLTTLAEARQRGHDVTPFMAFALRGLAIQSHRLLTEIQRHISKALFRSLAVELFGRLETPRKRAIAERQLDILNRLLEVDSMDFDQLVSTVLGRYSGVENRVKAVIRDLRSLLNLGAISVERVGENEWRLAVRLPWPTEITETDFLKRIKDFPKAKTLSFLR